MGEMTFLIAEIAWPLWTRKMGMARVFADVASHRTVTFSKDVSGLFVTSWC